MARTTLLYVIYFCSVLLSLRWKRCSYIMLPYFCSFNSQRRRRRWWWRWWWWWSFSWKRSPIWRDEIKLNDSNVCLFVVLNSTFVALQCKIINYLNIRVSNCSIKFSLQAWRILIATYTVEFLLLLLLKLFINKLQCWLKEATRNKNWKKRKHCKADSAEQ